MSVSTKARTRGRPLQSSIVHAKVAEALLGSIVYDTRTFNRDWPEAGMRNREIDPKQVTSLMEVFRSGIHQFGPTNHLIATTTKDNYNKCMHLAMAKSGVDVAGLLRSGDQSLDQQREEWIAKTRRIVSTF